MTDKQFTKKLSALVIASNDWSADSRHDTAAQQRATARRNYGWRQQGPLDYCAACWQYKAKRFATECHQSGAEFVTPDQMPEKEKETYQVETIDDQRK